MASNILNKDLNNGYIWCFGGKTEKLNTLMFISLLSPPTLIKTDFFTSIKAPKTWDLALIIFPKM